ncbi:MAG: methylenetetrahydrofolate reductase C-terminal domain-containing protein [Candidatus Omnitrophica bacterium]|nr:methylenetetrahydrofolate reductase C-terminal domain-containing protein [Candidatus Omnitrophota bacterium]MDD5506425.1 methylenetetrahydrofolate reductase C-terminal domain-containing protein [Candidatus Omnitrophota bacterium]
MIITEPKPFTSIIDSLKSYSRIFLVGCGECATTCKTGGEPEILKMKQDLEAQGKTVVGFCIPSAPCLAAKLKSELAKNLPALRQAEAVLVLSCGLGVQSFKDNDRLNLAVFPACNTIFGAVMDAKGDFYEKCSLCGECVLDLTGGVCPVTLCAKGLLNGPCGGMNKGKCEVDKDRDCAWVLIYKELEKKNKLASLKEIRAPKDFKKSAKPHKLILVK